MSIADEIGSATSLVSQVGNLLGITTTPSNNISLTVNNQIISGWQKVRITRSVEKIPSDFDIELTESFPSSLSTISVLPGQACELKIGNDLVLTGYVDRYQPKIDDSSHTITMMGRSKCMDLVDCSAEWDGCQISGTSAADIASKLAAKYGILVTLLQDEVTLKPIQQFNMMYGETAGEIIERVCKFNALLYYDDVDGNLILSQVSKTDIASSGFTEGVNVQQASANFCADQRFSQYTVVIQATATLGDQPKNGDSKSTVFDPGVIRNRKKIIVAEGGYQGKEITEKRAIWERNRREGRGYQIEVVTDTWRDSAGKLWTPNTLAPVNIPSMKLANVMFTIGEVTYMLDENGTTARLVLMPPSAYSVEPILIQQQPLVEAGAIMNVPGGNQNPAAPSLAPATSSPATSTTPTDSDTAIRYLFDSGGSTALFTPALTTSTQK